MNIFNGSYNLAWQKGAYALFARVDLTLELPVPGSLGISVASTADLGEWQSSIQFAIDLFRQSFKEAVSSELGGIRVTKIAIDSQPYDTTLCCVAFSVFHALCQALKVDGRSVFAFDTEQGRFTVMESTLPTTYA